MKLYCEYVVKKVIYYTNLFNTTSYIKLNITLNMVALLLQIMSHPLVLLCPLSCKDH